jgi:cytochrome c oxidase subunit IV
MHRVSSAGWAFLIVAVSLGAAYAFDAAGVQGLARAALVPVYPVLLAVLAVAGGFHTASGESRWMVITGVVSFFVWWGIIAGWRRWRSA